MAKIVTVHGTYAHIASAPPVAGTGDSENKQWWQPGSAFEDRIKQLVEGESPPPDSGSTVEFKPFVWKGDNSETVRREAGSRLLKELGQLEEQGETYVVVGHSHGGSVISAALLEAAARRIKLDGMKRWITIGTPFVELRRERFLFLRLPLLLKAMFVASLMLLFMYLFYALAELVDGRVNLNNERQLIRLVISTVLTAIPFGVFYLIALFVDRRQLFFYRKRNREKAKDQFADRWIALSHEDDEAVRGLGSLSRLKLQIFHREFAVPALSMMSVFILPLIYLAVVMSPGLMVSIASFLKDDVYQIQAYAEKESSAEQMLRSVRRTTRQIRTTRQALADETDDDRVRRLELESELKKLIAQRREQRRQMNQKFPEMTQIRRAVRFERRFLRENGEPCADGQLCGKGYNVLLNAKLLFHLVTDEVASWVIDHGVGRGIMSRVVRSAVPVLLVPLVFGIAAVVMVLIVQFLARQFSRIASGWFDRQTWAEIRRNAVGNDTEAEVAVGAVPTPPWLDRNAAFLPTAVGSEISRHSDRAMAESISKIRNSISEFALGEGPDGQIGSALNYLSWQELIHTSYFEVPAFQKLVARAIVSGDGFKPTSAFQADPQFDDTGQWLLAVSAPQSGEG